MSLLFVAVILILGMLSIVFFSIKNGISPTASSPKVKRLLFAFLPIGIEGNIYDLGSGWGGSARLLARSYPKAQIIAYETSPIPYFFSFLWNKMLPLENLEFHREDFFEKDLSEADLVFSYLYPGAMEALDKKFGRELKRGAFVVTHTFALPHWEAIKKETAEDLYNTPIYLYQKK